jgi:Flp pilus assembly protein TadD
MAYDYVDSVEAAPFFRRVDWAAFWAATLIALGVYTWTLAPTVTLEDSGELATASAFLGVPHPPGYPIWTVVTWLFTKIFAFVTFRGQPNPAWAVGFASAVAGAMAAGFTAMLVCRSGSQMLKHSKKISGTLDSTADDLICWVASVTCSLLFAFTPNMWSQAVIVEVYALNAFFLMLIFLLSYRWMCQPSDRTLFAVAFAFGLGLTNYQVLLLAMLPLAFALMLRDMKLFLNFLAVGVPYIAVIYLMTPGDGGQSVLPQISHPMDASGITYFVLNIVALTLAYFLLPRGRTVALTILLVELGVAFYVYMPLASDLRNPPMNWGYPRTWEGFKHALSRGQYEKIVPTQVLSMHFVNQIGDYFKDLRRQFWLPIVLLGFLPFTAWRIRMKGWRFNALIAAILLAVPAALLSVVEEALFPGGHKGLTMLYKALIVPIMVLMGVGGIGIAITQFKEIVLNRRSVAASDADSGESSEECEVIIDSYSQKWIVATLLGFLAMSFVLIALANPKGDIQDAFIQKVKFISSHALFAIFIGYGLIFGMAFMENLFRGNQFARWLVLAAGCLLPLVPIRENYYDRELLRVFGGSEMNGHDFGWQFGNYQLRGAPAIREELAPEEEPLPNPLFPPDMEIDAIFFGGTDPGRFVPTYMIYAARVREDVYLITQNALADNTYMSVMRDLYGDQIWIPAVHDSGRSFQRYVEEVQSGKRPRNADLKIENGRVSVQGALGVMEINGILAEMIFERNKYRHAFYVEESYVIRWMYDYLTPHGLIMKINSEKTDLPPDVVVDDMEFWDWYTRRLVGTEAFLRDVVARKSFSKLRSAIAGLYAVRGRFVEAENAFLQARMLYPLSPEANFRLAQEVYAPTRRFSDSVNLMKEFHDWDPGNDRVQDFINQLKRLEDLHKRIRELEAIRNSGRPMDVMQAMELGGCYLQVGQRHLFLGMINGVLATSNMPFQIYLNAAVMLRNAQSLPEMVRALDMGMNVLQPAQMTPALLQQMAQLYGAANEMDKMGAVIRIYLKRTPNDWRAWLDLAAIEVTMKRGPDATKALEAALRVGGSEALMLIQQDDRFATIRQAAQNRVKNLGMGPF